MEGAAAIPEAVRRLAEHPYSELPVPPSAEWIERAGVERLGFVQLAAARVFFDNL